MTTPTDSETVAADITLGEDLWLHVYHDLGGQLLR